MRSNNKLVEYKYRISRNSRYITQRLIKQIIDRERYQYYLFFDIYIYIGVGYKTGWHTSFSEITLIDVSLSNNRGEIFLRPLLGGHILLKNHHLLKSHFFELLRILQYNCCKHVHNKIEVITLVCNVRIKHP